MFGVEVSWLYSLETMSVAVYVLAGYDRGDAFSAEAATFAR